MKHVGLYIWPCIILALIFYLIGYNTTSYSKSSDLSRNWPELVYHLISPDYVVRVSPDSLKLGNRYLALHQSYLPTFISGHFTEDMSKPDGILDLRNHLPMSDTVMLRIICSEKDAELKAIKGVIDELQGRINSLWLGKKIEYVVIVRESNYLKKLNNKSLVSFNSDHLNWDTINILIAPQFRRNSHANRYDKTIRLTRDGFFQSELLLHEFGHMFYASHPDACCNLCNCASKHFMYKSLSVEAIRNQIMISDLLGIIDKCDGPICNSCKTNIKVGCDGDDKPRVIADIIDLIHYDSTDIVREKMGSMLDLRRGLESTYKRIKSDESALASKYRQEHEWYGSHGGSSKESIDRLVKLKVQSRRNFRLERFELILNELNKLPNVDNRHISHLLKKTIESLETGVFKESNWQ